MVVFIMNATECNKDRIILHDRKSDSNCQQQNGTNFQGVARSTGGWVGWLAGKGMQLGVMGRKLQAAIKCRAWVTEHKLHKSLKL
jgi:hypothetical protein